MIKRTTLVMVAVCGLALPSLALNSKRDVSQLIRDLKSGEPEKREHAAQALAQMGPAAEGAIDALQGALNDDFPYVRTHASQALSKIGPAAIPAFIKALKNPNGDVRSSAAAALTQFGPAASTAIPQLVEALRDTDSSVKERASGALERIGPAAVVPLLHFLENNPGSSTLLALRALGGIRSDEETFVPRLLKLLEHSDPQVRLGTVKVLARQGKHHVPALIRGLQSDKEGVRALVADVLSDVGRNAAAAVPDLTALLSDASSSVRASAARALGRMGSEAAGTAVAPLRQLLTDPDRTVTIRAREALTNLTATTESTESIPETPRLLSAPDPVLPPASVKKEVKIPARPAPAAIPKKSKKVLSIAQLIKMLQSPNEAVRSAALKGLIESGPQAVPKLTAALRDGTTSVRQSVATAFIQIDSTAAVEAFQICATNVDAGVRLDALSALQTMGPGAAAATAKMTDLLKDPSTDIQAAAEKVLVGIGSQEAIKALDAWHQAKLQKQITALTNALRQEGKPAEEAQADLVKIGPPVIARVSALLTDTSVPGRRGAARVLLLLAPGSAGVTPALTAALNDPDEEVRRTCAQALEKINTPEAKKAVRFFQWKERVRSILKRLHLT